MLILILGSRSGFGGDFGQYGTKPLFYVIFFWQRPLRNSVATGTLKIPDDQRLFERMCNMLKLKVTKFQLPRLNGF